ncbi:response regulator transcription factor [Desulfococcaceae bacterium HSG9]|nr:response regulator transcription factor [Desulfococcaceae bacterium HSG9]
MKKTGKKRIMVIEDELHIAEGLKVNLVLQGYDVKICADGLTGIREWKQWNADLIVLDIMLPGIDGLSILQNIRLENERLPILILSAKGAPKDKIKGFSYGVDDYITKPFNLEEFLLRVERLLTRVSWNRNEIAENQPNNHLALQSYTFGDNHINFRKSTAQCKKGEIKLTFQEIKLLKLFIRNRGEPLTRKQLLEIGWGYARGITTRTIDNFIVRLRKYFEANPKKPVYFKSLRSIGYIFDHKTDDKE